MNYTDARYRFQHIHNGPLLQSWRWVSGLWVTNLVWVTWVMWHSVTWVMDHWLWPIDHRLFMKLVNKGFAITSLIPVSSVSGLFYRKLYCCFPVLKRRSVNLCFTLTRLIAQLTASELHHTLCNSMQQSRCQHMSVIHKRVYTLLWNCLSYKATNKGIPPTSIKHIQFTEKCIIDNDPYKICDPKPTDPLWALVGVTLE